MEIRDLTIREVSRASERCVLLKLTDERQPLDEFIFPGQFVEVRVDGSPTTFLRRPISICFVDYRANELWLLVAAVGDGTRRIAAMKPGEKLNCVLPLGNKFECDILFDKKVLLVGGGVGVAPLLFMGSRLFLQSEGDAKRGSFTHFLLGARTKDDLLLLDEFRKYGRVEVTTEDGSMGVKGFVTDHPLLQEEHFDRILTCGPTPMMKAVARYARQNGIDCQVSLENMMACGLGACLCCVEKTVRGNLCVCKDGPVFNVKELLWE